MGTDCMPEGNSSLKLTELRDKGKEVGYTSVLPSARELLPFASKLVCGSWLAVGLGTYSSLLCIHGGQG